jgi:hypothetical protein
VANEGGGRCVANEGGASPAPTIHENSGTMWVVATEKEDFDA